jgi:hypothetical protein
MKIEFDKELDNPQGASYKNIAKDLERFIGQTTCSLFPLIAFIGEIEKLAKKEEA